METLLFFTIYWLTGEVTYLVGTDVANAFQRAGISAGALRAVDFIADGLDFGYECDSANRWMKRTPPEYVNLLEMKVMGESFFDFHIHYLMSKLKELGIVFEHDELEKKFMVRREDLATIWRLG